MRVFDEGSLFRVQVSSVDVDEFNNRWPGSRLAGCMQVFAFSKSNGDLVQAIVTGGPEEAVKALCEDARDYGQRKLKLGKYAKSTGFPRTVGDFRRRLDGLPDDMQVAVEWKELPGKNDPRVVLHDVKVLGGAFAFMVGVEYLD